MDQLGSSLRGEMEGLRAELANTNLAIASSADRLRAEFYQDQNRQTKTLVIAMIASTFTTITAVAGVVFGAAQLI